MFQSNSYDGFSHNLYINQIAQLTFRYNLSRKTTSEGHLLKSRARKNFILYNRLTGEDGGSSYEINLPNGGESYVVGNVLQQGASTGNRAMIDYLSEGAGTGFDKRIYVVNNTLVNERSGGATFLQLAGATDVQSLAANNLLVGGGTVLSGPAIRQMANLAMDQPFVDAAKFDYRLKQGAPAIGAGVDPGSENGYALTPVNQYADPAGAAGRPKGAKLDAGAFQYVP